MNNDVKEPKKEVFPNRVTLELTNSCNYNCVFCPRRLMTHEIGFLSTDLAKRLADEIAGHLPVCLVPFFRGEPLLHPNWRNILSYIKKKGIGPIQLTTNGSLLDSEASSFIIDHRIDFVSFSLDTTDDKLYESSRRGSRYRAVLENILTFLSMKEKSGGRLPEVQVSAVETQEYRPGIDEFVSFWRPKVDRVRIYVEHSTGNSPGNIDYRLPVYDRRLPCFKPFEDFVVLWNGDVALCNHDWTRDTAVPIGNVNHHTIEEIWNSDRYNAIREMHLSGNLFFEQICNQCDHWKMYHLQERYIGKLYK